MMTEIEEYNLEISDSIKTIETDLKLLLSSKATVSASEMLKISIKSKSKINSLKELDIQNEINSFKNEINFYDSDCKILADLTYEKLKKRFEKL